jgi:hypothetical protein
MNRDELSAASRTVIDLAEYFRELKERAAQLQAQIGPSDRGYFTPDEESSTRSLLISYWQARNALFELITSFRDDDSLDAASRPRAFLIAFAAALILVDAARFLRELVASRPVVRSKLNEPAPELGVPPGVYDTVQKSLVSARQGWHLYHAIRYFEEHEAELRAQADSERTALLAIIDGLRHRLDVSILDFTRAKLRTRADQLSRRVARSLLGRALYGLQKLAGSLVADKYLRYGHQPCLPKDTAERVQALLLPGDVLIVRKEYALTNYFLPGYWPHAALYLGDAAALHSLGLFDHENAKPTWRELLELSGDPSSAFDSKKVLESMKDGVHVRSVDSPFSSDSIVVLRPRLSRAEIRDGLARVLLHEGKSYDFDFDFRRADKLVCTEVVYRAYEGVGGVTFPLKPRAGRPTLSGSDLIRMGIVQQHLEPVAVFAPAFTPEIVTGSGVVPMLKRGEAS